MPSRLRSRVSRIGELAATLLVLPLLLPLVVVVLAAYFLYGFTLQLLIWVCWCTRGTRVLFVYSNSPVWREYLQREVVPRLPRKTVVLDWSERRKWRPWSLDVLAFRYFGGHREYSPMAVVFRPFHWARTFRFYRAFRDFKHGKTRRVEETLQALLRCL